MSWILDQEKRLEEDGWVRKIGHAQIWRKGWLEIELYPHQSVLFRVDSEQGPLAFPGKSYVEVKQFLADSAKLYGQAYQICFMDSSSYELLLLKKLQAEREELQAEREELQAEREELQAEREELQDERAELQAERAELQAERDTLADVQKVQIEMSKLFEKCVEGLRTQDQRKALERIEWLESERNALLSKLEERDGYIHGLREGFERECRSLKEELRRVANRIG